MGMNGRILLSLVVGILILGFYPALGMVVNVGLDSNFAIRVQDDTSKITAFTVFEPSQGNTDLNGDGDTLDSVVHVYDHTTGVTTNLGLNVFGDIKVDKGLVAFSVEESSEGNTDLNGDGDTLDSIVHVYDHTTGSTTNISLSANSFSFHIDSILLSFSVFESNQGNTDLNGDGDAIDSVVHVYDASTGLTTNTGFVGNGSMDGNLVVFEVSESLQGNIDLNGDGDTLDSIVHVYDHTTGLTTNTGLNGFNPVVRGSLVAVTVSEGLEGIDLNGDGDAIDPVLHIYDHNTGTPTNIGLASSNFSLEGVLIVFLVFEPSQGNTDLNGDGDTSDSVVHVYDASTNTSTNLGVSSFLNKIVGGTFVTLSVFENAQGNTDLNGDGDTSDSVVHVYDHATGSVTNGGIVGSPFAEDDGIVPFTVSEFSQGNTDLNGDGDTSDSIVHVYDHSVGFPATNLGVSSFFGTTVFGDRVAFLVDEASQGNTDLNGDGDVSDTVVHYYEHMTGLTTNLGFQSFNPVINGTLISFSVQESSQGNTDLNGDGDTSDNRILHVFTIPPPGPVLCDGQVPTIIAGSGQISISGTNGDDVILGNELDNVINGRGGNDTICAGDGDDTVNGRQGNDTIFGEGGNDILNGNNGDDIINGGEGNDIIKGGGNDDILHGGDGIDDIRGNGGADQLFGDEGIDVLRGGAGIDTADGGGEDDLIFGGQDGDTLLGGNGDDTIFGNAGQDTINGGMGNDKIIGNGDVDTLNGNEGDDYIDGSQGIDVCDGGTGNNLLINCP